MKTYSIINNIGAIVSKDIEANNLDEAIDKFWDDPPYSGLCHQCARYVEIGEGSEVCVYVDGEQVYDDYAIFYKNKIKSLEEEIKKLRGK